jgi:hypothetical protein
MGKPEPEPGLARAGARWRQPVVLLEDHLELRAGNADAGVPDLDAQAVAADPAAADQDAASALGVFDRVRQQVPGQPLQQARIAPGHGGARHRAQLKASVFGQEAELAAQPVQQTLDGEARDLRPDLPGVEPVDVEQAVDDVPHRRDLLGELLQHPPAGLVPHALRQHASEEADGLQRLPQIVARRRDEARLQGVG